MSVQDDIARIVWNLEVPPHTSVSIDTCNHDVETRIEPVSKHDGKLPAEIGLSPDGDVQWVGDYISIRCGDDFVILDRKQGSSLLSWLQQEQEKGKLEGLAKEQAE